MEARQNKDGFADFISGVGPSLIEGLLGIFGQGIQNQRDDQQLQLLFQGDPELGIPGLGQQFANRAQFEADRNTSIFGGGQSGGRLSGRNGSGRSAPGLFQQRQTLLQNFGDSERTDIMNSLGKLRSTNRANLASRGLSGTTLGVGQSLSENNTQTRALGRLNENIRNERSGLLGEEITARTNLRNPNVDPATLLAISNGFNQGS